MADIELSSALATLGYTAPFTGTWAARPAATSSAGRYAFFTMADGRKSAMVSDGARWRPVYAYAVLQPNASVTGTLTETTLLTLTIPGGLLGADGTLRVYALFSYTGTAGTKTVRCKLGGQAFVNLAAAATNASTSVFKSLVNLSATSQLAMPAAALNDGLVAGGSVFTSTVDSTADQPLTITMQLANISDSATLQKVIVEIL